MTLDGNRTWYVMLISSNHYQWGMPETFRPLEVYVNRKVTF